MTEYDTDGQAEIICPHCGKSQSDSWDYTEDGVCDCEHCEKEFMMYREETVQYTTSKNTRHIVVCSRKDEGQCDKCDRNRYCRSYAEQQANNIYTDDTDELKEGE